MDNEASITNLSRFFDSEVHSDVKIKCGDRVFNCHKIILCDRSEYFRKLCGPESRFSEANQSTIELKEDSPDAIEAIMRFIYGVNWMSSSPRQHNPYFHLDVCMAAQKYLLPKLEQQAAGYFQTLLQKVKDPRATFEFLFTYKDVEGQNTKVDNAVEKLVEDLLAGLMRIAEFRRLLDHDKFLLDLVCKTLEKKKMRT